MLEAGFSGCACRAWRRRVNTLRLLDSYDEELMHGKENLSLRLNIHIESGRHPLKSGSSGYASNAMRFEEGYRTIADCVKLPRGDEPTADILRLITDWLCDEANGQ